MSIVYPIEGRFIQGVPHVPHECDHEPPCVDTGAFTDKPPKADKQTETPASAGVLDSTED